MNLGVSPSSRDGVFLVKYADCKCLAVRGANGRGKSFYDGTEMPDDIKVVIAVPIELILPSLTDIKRVQMCPVSSPDRK